MPNRWEKTKMNEGLLSLHDPGKEEFQTQVFAIWAAYRMTPFKGKIIKMLLPQNPWKPGAAEPAPREERL